MGESLSDFGKAAKLLGACEGDALGKAFSELGMKSEALSVKLQREVGYNWKLSLLELVVPEVYVQTHHICYLESPFFLKGDNFSIRGRSAKEIWHMPLYYSAGPSTSYEFWRTFEGLCSSCAIHKGKLGFYFG